MNDLPREDRPEMMRKDNDDSSPQVRAVALVWAIFYEDKLPVEDIYVVWFCYTVGSWKALISTNAKDDRYYEVTYDGNKREVYVDSYMKVENYTIPEADLEL